MLSNVNTTACISQLAFRETHVDGCAVHSLFSCLLSLTCPPEHWNAPCEPTARVYAVNYDFWTVEAGCQDQRGCLVHVNTNASSGPAAASMGFHMIEVQGSVYGMYEANTCSCRDHPRLELLTPPAVSLRLGGYSCHCMSKRGSEVGHICWYKPTPQHSWGCHGISH